MYELLKNDHKPSGKRPVLLETNKGVLDVEDQIEAEDSVFITAPAPQHSNQTISLNDICGVLGARNDSINKGMPTGIVDAGNETLCVPIRSLEDIVKVSPDYETLKTFCSKHGLDVVTVFTDDVADKTRAYRTRVFAAPFGYLEDPATGSGNAALGYHLLKHGLWRGERITLEQNNDKWNPNIIKMATKVDESGSLRVTFGGSAITRIEGYYTI